VFSTVSFTLLGLWLVVVQTRFDDWAGSRAHLRMAYAIFLNFAVPAAMSVLSLVNPNSAALWRISFCGAAAIGAVGVVLAGAPARHQRGAVPVFAVGRWAAVVIYVAVALVALFSGAVSQALDGLNALQVEAILLSVLVLVNLNVAWAVLVAE
jgi:hypothetical protein